jgi:hypothetical protein
MLTRIPFNWDQLDEIVCHLFDKAMVDDSKRWVAIGNAPSIGNALAFARMLKRNYCSSVFVTEDTTTLGHVALWFDVLSWELTETDA